ncbi:ribonuclease [Niallia sp. FSL K6-0212]|uniref:ribonuclease n=1 Tax=Niallia sp. FSL K6-0212 TaxID=2921423 RepID=UPI0030F7CB3A
MVETKKKKSIFKKWWFYVGIIAVLALIGAIQDLADNGKIDSPKENAEVKKDNPKEEKVDSKTKEVATTPKIEKKEEPKNDETEQEIKNYKKIYDEKIKPFMTEYDKIWNENWKPAMSKISNDPNKFKEIKGEMDKVQEGYDNLNLKIIDWKAKGLNDDNNKQLEEYRENFSQAVSYRSNAARAINQAIDGVADLESRFEEAKKSIELSDKYVLNAAVTLTKLENKLGLIKKEEK